MYTNQTNPLFQLIVKLLFIYIHVLFVLASQKSGLINV